MNEFFQSAYARKLAKVLFACVLVFTFFLIVLSLNALKENRFIGRNIPPMNVVSVTGEGEVFAIPDVARFTFTVNTEAGSVEAAQNETSTKINAALAALKDKGVEDKDIKTISYNAYPRYEYRDVRTQAFPPTSDTRVLAGYNVSQTIQVKIRDTAKAGEVLGAMGGLEVENISGLSFTIDDESELLKEAQALAIADAKEKAEVLARSLGVKLNRIVSFSDMSDYYPYARSEKAFAGVAMDAYATNPAPMVETPMGESLITSRVMISYEIR